MGVIQEFKEFAVKGNVMDRFAQFKGKKPCRVNHVVFT